MNPLVAQRNITNGSNVVNTQSNQFSDKLRKAMSGFTKDLESANDSINKAVIGESDQYLDFLIQTEKNAMNLQIALQVRNKVVDAYNEIMRMQL